MTATEPQRILVIKLADFGDALLTTPGVAAIRRRWPEAQIDVLTGRLAAVAYEASGLVNNVILLDRSGSGPGTGSLGRLRSIIALARRIRAERYEAVALFHRLTLRLGSLKHAAVCLVTGAPVRAGLAWPGSRRGWFLTHKALDLGFDAMHEVEAGLAVAAVLVNAFGGSQIGSVGEVQSSGAAERRRIAFGTRLGDETQAKALLDPLEPRVRPRVAIHPGGGSYSLARRWPPPSFAALADRLAEAGADVILVGTATDDTASVRASCRHDPALDLTGQTSLPTLAALLRNVDVLVANDGGIMHLAAAMGTPVVAVFGPSNAVAWGPWWPSAPASSPHRVVSLPDLPCRPCLYVGHRLGAREGCATRDCLTWLGADRVFDEVWSSLDALGLARTGDAQASGRPPV